MPATNYKKARDFFRERMKSRMSDDGLLVEGGIFLGSGKKSQPSRSGVFGKERGEGHRRKALIYALPTL